MDADVVVVGGGNAGLSAALAASEAGVNVVLLEAGALHERGGNSRFTGGLFRTSFETIKDVVDLAPQADIGQWESLGRPLYTRETYYDDVMRLTGGRADPELTRMYVDLSFETMKWLNSLGGVEWSFNLLKWAIPTPGAAFRAQGMGIGLVESLYSAAEELGVGVHYSAYASDWASRKGAVSVKYEDSTGTKEVIARALVLASGGFEASAEKRARYLGSRGDLLKVRGIRYNTGRMLDVALERGALATGQWAGCHATPVDARSVDSVDPAAAHSWSRHAFPFSIMLNRNGKRFIDEGADYSLFTYARMGSAILEQPSALAFQLFDSETIQYVDERYSEDAAITDGTLSGVLVSLGQEFPLDSAQALRTVEEFNHAVTDSPFNPMTLDGKRTNGLRPDKSNWALPVQSGPFYAYPITAGITFTYGGLAIDTRARVLNLERQPVPGVFATGEVTGGFFYDNYPAGAGLMRGAVFGRVAGTEAARVVDSS